MHRHVDLAVVDGFPQRGGEYPDADVGDRLGRPVALGADDHQLGVMTLGQQGIADAAGLGGGQQAAPGTYPDHVGQAATLRNQLGQQGNSPAVATASTAVWSSSNSSRSASA